MNRQAIRLLRRLRIGHLHAGVRRNRSNRAPKHASEPILQKHRQRSNLDTTQRLVAERPREREREDAGWQKPTLGGDRLLDDPLRWPNADVLRAFLSIERRQAAEISLDEWLQSRHIEAADEHEREVARVREAVLVERQRLFDINLADHLGREPAGAHVVLGKRVLHHTLVDLDVNVVAPPAR